MTFRTVGRVALVIFLAAVLSAAGLFLVIRHPSVQQYGLNYLSRTTGYDLNAGKIRLRMGWKPGVYLKDIQVGTQQGMRLLSASDLTLTPNLSDMLFSETGTGFSGSVNAENVKFQLAESGEVKDYHLSEVLFKGKYTLNPQVLGISSLKINTSGTWLSATGQVRLTPRETSGLELTVTSPIMTVGAFKSIFPDLLLPDWIRLELLPAIQSGDIHVETIALKADLNQVQAENNLLITDSAISLRDIKAIHPALQLPLFIGSATIASEPMGPFQFTGKGLLGKSDFQFQGSVDNRWQQLSAKVTTSADVQELVESRLPKSNIGAWIYGPLEAQAMLDGEGVTLDPARIDVGKGYLRFKGRQAFRPSTGMHWISHLHIVQEPARNLVQLIRPGAVLLDGTASLEGLLTLKEPDGSGAFSGLNGHAWLLVEKGWIHQSSPILDALALISLERIFKPGSPGVQDGRLYFDRMEASLEIEKGKILVQSLTLQSPAINAVGAGTIDLNRDHLQLRIGLQPLGTVDSIVSSIPVIGNILTGKEKSLVVYSLEITGSLSNPRVKSIPFKNLGESALGYIERLVFTPERFLKSLLSLKDPRSPAAAPDYHAEFDRIHPAP